MLFERAKSLVALDVLSSSGRDLVQDDTTPHVAILQTVESFIASLHKPVNTLCVAHLVVLSPVAGHLQLGRLIVRVFTVAEVINQKWHVSAVLAEES